MSEQLQANGNPVRVGGVTLRTPGLAGVANAYLPATTGLRAITRTTDALEDALNAEGMRTTETIEITGAREVPGPARGSRSTNLGEPAIELDVPDPGESWGQVILYTDEAGVTQWAFARDASNAISVTRGRGTRTYVIPRRVPAAPPQTDSRGLVGAIGKKVLRVLVFPLIDPVIGEVGDYFAARWEKAKRPYGLRLVTPGSLSSPDGALVDGAAWAQLAVGPSLLLMHGTFSRTHTAFGGLPETVLTELLSRYEGRVFAFDHFTLSEDPRQNVDWLLREVPDGARLDLDVVAHSRGGLVARVLAEKQGELSMGSREINLRKAVLVAVPNAGTLLADIDHWDNLVETYTTLLNFFPDNGVTETLEAIVTVVKQIAVAALKGLEGLMSMQPGGAFLTSLNAAPAASTRYYALASNYEPVDTNPGISSYKNFLFDKLFRAHNDLVVPTDGVWDANGSAAFPITERHVFEAGDAVHHGGFFSNAAATDKILAWLQE